MLAHIVCGWVLVELRIYLYACERVGFDCLTFVFVSLSYLY